MISGMALGWDTAWARAAMRMGVPLVCAIPFEGQERQWPEAAQQWYRTVLQFHAAEVVVAAYGGYTPQALHARNRWMMDHCDAVAALWDERPDGGTASCLRYAYAIGRPVENLWDEFLLTCVVPLR